MVSQAPARRSGVSRAKWGAAIAVLVVAAIALWYRGGSFFGKQYEYEEDLTLDLGGSATLTINSSIAALVALRGVDLDPDSPTVDRDRVRAIYDSPVARVTNIPRPWRRQGRQFVQINLQIPDIRRASELAPLAWSHYGLAAQNGETTFRQAVGGSALRPGSLKNYGWDGKEIVAFRLHLPSRILEHNARDLERNEPTGILRGNILAWEQHLSDRLDGRPVTVEVRMESESILYRTLWLFAGAFTAALLTLAGLIWWAMKRGNTAVPTSNSQLPAPKP
jgi:hypothetical protein